MNYVLVCFLFYSIMFYALATKDRFVQNQQGAQTLMLITIMNSLFHNIQYHAIVRFYGKERYFKNVESTTGTNEKDGFGLASWIGSSHVVYLLSALAMGLIFGGIVWLVGDWPAVTGSWEGVRSYTWAYVLFFGIIGHHFYLDQKIWRPSAQKDLNSYLFDKRGQRSSSASMLKSEHLDRFL